jgi:hypothetical protein
MELGLAALSLRVKNWYCGNHFESTLYSGTPAFLRNASICTACVLSACVAWPVPFLSKELNGYRRGNGQVRFAFPIQLGLKCTFKY